MAAGSMTRMVLPLAGAAILDGLAFGLLVRWIGFGGGVPRRSLLLGAEG